MRTLPASGPFVRVVTFRITPVTRLSRFGTPATPVTGPTTSGVSAAIAALAMRCPCACRTLMGVPLTE